jgi:5-hydroxyisourate hydrolase
MPKTLSPITTHVLDTARGLPASGVPVRLEMLREEQRPRLLGQGVTDADGRLGDLLRPGHVMETGAYQLVFETDVYFEATNTPAFFPYVVIVFRVTDPARHYHVPLLLSPYGYSTYRGS